GAFLILAAAPDPVFYRLGLAGGLGLLLCLTFLMVLLPAAWALIDRRTADPDAAATAFAVPGLARLAKIAARAPVATLVVIAPLLALSAVELSNLHYETNLERVFSRDIAAVATAKRIHEQFGIDPGPWLVAVRDLEEAREITAQFEQHPLFERAESLAFLFPRDLPERVAKLAALAPDLAKRVRREELARIQRDDAEPEASRQRIELMTGLLRAEALGPPRREALPTSLAERLIGRDGELLVYAFVAEPALDSAVAARERRAAQAIHPEATSMSVIYEALIGTDRPWMPSIVAMVALFIALVLYSDLRSVRLTLLALTPAATANVVTLGILSFSGFSFNTVTLVGVPLLLGLGVDDGIHIVHRMLEQPEKSIDSVVDAVGRSIAMTTATTCAGVVALLFTRHPGIESVAILMLVGLPLSLLASVTVLPACAVLTRSQEITRRRAGPVAQKKSSRSAG
ncbi:MAG: MMPL family transporter, partial [Deltaproteobacteria bacterium]|nr:MMPL family transporter [Deltaproteobacteria bacterium]